MRSTAASRPPIPLIMLLGLLPIHSIQAKTITADGVIRDDRSVLQHTDGIGFHSSIPNQPTPLSGNLNDPHPFTVSEKGAELPLRSFPGDDASDPSVSSSFHSLHVMTTGVKTRYRKNLIQSPLTQNVLDNINAVAALAPDHAEEMFIKVGDSISAGGGHMSQFLCQLDLPDWTPEMYSWDFARDISAQEYMRPALEYFLTLEVPSRVFEAGQEQYYSPFARDSLATMVGASAEWAVSGDPSPLAQEIEAMHPRYAIVMYGSNDVHGYGALAQKMDYIMRWFVPLIDNCISNGVIPIMTAPPLSGDLYAESITLGHLIRALSQDRQVPFLNYQHAMWSLPNHGLSGDDVHPTYAEYNQIAWFNPENLDYGYNLRNLLSLEALHRMYESRVATPSPLDPEPAGYLGSGTSTDPYIIDELAFVHTGVVSTAIPSIYYRLDANYALELRMVATGQGNSDIRVELLDAAMQPIVSGKGSIECTLSPGTCYVRVFPSGDPELTGGAYQFVAMDTDIQMPTVPQNFTVSSANGTVTLNWAASSDNQGVAGYRVFKNGRTYATTPELWFIDTDVVSGQEYFYSVSAFDRADIESYHSTLTQIVVQGEQPPPVNHPPVLALIGHQTIIVGQAIQFTIQASDEDAGAILEYAACGPN